MNNPFFTFIKPFLSYIDSGKIYRKPISWLYIIIAGANLLAPLYVLYEMFGSFRYMEGKVIFISIFLWLFILVSGWICFQLWWNRKDNVNLSSEENAEFSATPVLSHLFQTTGECAGIWIAIVGFGAGLSSLFVSDSFGIMSEFSSYGIAGIVIMPLIGFFVFLFFRFIAEMIRVLTSIANNTKK